MLDELIALQQRGIVSVLEGSPAAVRDTYIDIFDVLNGDMKSAGLTEDRAVTSIRNKPHIKKAVERWPRQVRGLRTTRSRAVSRFAGGLHGRSSQFMKQVAPKSAQFARAFLNTADTSRLVKFYSAPFAAIVAAIAANLLCPRSRGRGGAYGRRIVTGSSRSVVDMTERKARAKSASKVGTGTHPHTQT